MIMWALLVLGIVGFGVCFASAQGEAEEPTEPFNRDFKQLVKAIRDLFIEIYTTGNGKDAEIPYRVVSEEFWGEVCETLKNPENGPKFCNNHTEITNKLKAVENIGNNIILRNHLGYSNAAI